MEADKQINYQRITKAIEFIKQNYKDQPNLDQIAEKVHLSPFHFQKLFTEWAGVSPKKFLQFISLEHAKNILKNEQTTLFDAAYEVGLSGTGRLHDLFIKIEGMTPGEFKNGGENLSIAFTFSESIFGNILIGSTPKGICYMSFITDKNEGLAALREKFPNAVITHQPNENHQNALKIFNNNWNQVEQIKLHLKGSPFQLKVWEALLKIPTTQLTTYGAIATKIKKPKASRAVGTAIGRNPVAFLIPCHRVIQANGSLGGYMWGTTRKSAIIGWEAAQSKNNQ